MVSKSLLLSGYFGFGNVGDDAILEVFAQQWRRRRPADRLRVLAADGWTGDPSLGLEAIPRRRMQAVQAVMRVSDAFVCGGGGLLQDATSLRSLLYYAGLIRQAVRLGVPAAIFAQSIGPLSPIGRLVVRALCSGVAHASARDGASAALLARLLPRTEVATVADPAFLLQPADDDVMARWLDEHGLRGVSEFIVVAPRRVRGFVRVAARIATFIDRLRTTHGVPAVFVAFQSPGDAEAATHIIKRCRTSPALLGERLTPSEMAALVSRATAVVGVRFHAAVFAASATTPFCAVAYDPKVTGLLDALGYPLPALSADVDPRELADRLWSERVSLRAHLAARLPEMQRRASAAFDALATMVERAPARTAAGEA